ncbi:MAG: DNA topoisomerase [Rikenellaceae bacterium]
MKTIIAEKPSVAREIARIVGAKEKKNGYFEGDEYYVTWAFGHLVQPSMPEGYGFKGFHRDNLPIIPPVFMLVPRQIRTKSGYKTDEGVKAQLEVIKRLFNRSEKIIVATDAGREGELIFRYLYEYLKCTTPFDRLWISSLTDRAIKEGMRRLECGSNYDNLYRAAKARSEADWLVGINATQAISIVAGQGTHSLGRVQTPTLSMVCNRYWENKRFEPQPIFQIHISVEGDENIEIVKFDSVVKWNDKQTATEIFNECKEMSNIWIKQVESVERVESAPLLYDLTTLQKDANVRYGYTAEETLSIAQRLYELKLITYPRTGSRHITDDVFAEVSMLLRFLKSNDIHTDYIERLGRARRNCVDDSCVTDHHALLITGLKIGDIAPRERNIYDMIVERMLEAFSDSCIKDVTTIKAECAGVELVAKGVAIKQIGWRAFKKEDLDNVILPQFEEGDTPTIKAYSLTEGKSKPKPLHTESSLLAAMQSAGKEIEDQELRASIKEIGIGTPATRANIIETLVKRGYLVRQKRLLLPTELGLALNAVVKTMQIANVELTADWENHLLKIERGEADSGEFRRSIEEFTKEITSEILTCKKLFAVKRETEHLCPKCNTGKLRFYTKVVKCDNEECAKPFFRVIAGKTLKESEMIELLTTGKTGILRGFNSKQRRTFSAGLMLDGDFNVKFIFAK